MQGLRVLRSRFFWRLYATYALLVAATAVLIGVLVNQDLEDALFNQVEESLSKANYLIEPFGLEVLAAREADPLLQTRAVALGTNAGVRITVITSGGVVLADSLRDPDELDNHGDREEFQAALNDGFGTAQRRSDSTSRPTYYWARAVTQGEALLGVLRTSLPLTEEQARLATIQGRVLLGAGLGMLAALLMGLLIAGRITRPILQMKRVAEDLRQEKYDSRVELLPRDEVGLLGDTLNRLGVEITRRIATISREDARLLAILAGMVEGVVAVDESDRLIFANKAARRLLDLSQDSEGHRKLWEEVRLPELQGLLETARGENNPVRKEIELLGRSQGTILEAFAAPFAGGGQRGLVLVIHDITDLRRLERIRRDFVANVSHELKTPLTSIRGYVDTLLDGALEDRANNRRFLEKIDTHVERLTHLVTDLLSLARIEAQEGHFRLDELDLARLASKLVPRYEEAAKRKGLEFEYVLEGAAVNVKADPEALTQILDNLLDNAIKYTPPQGRVRLRVLQSGSRGVLEVEDSGIGIPAKDLDRIFERFYRVDKARSRELGGTGLGLSIVKHLAQAMGGDIEVESREDEGSRFTVRLDLA